MKMLWQRTAWVVAGGGALLAACWFLAGSGPEDVPFLPGCVFHAATGLNCPGCGMTRATFAVLHGRMGEAFRMNPLGMILLPVAFVGIGLEMLGWMRGRPLSVRLNFGIAGTWWVVGAIFAFWVLRNLPWFPFTFLSPPV
jgi:hypothetical protein